MVKYLFEFTINLVCKQCQNTDSEKNTMKFFYAQYIVCYYFDADVNNNKVQLVYDFVGANISGDCLIPTDSTDECSEDSESDVAWRCFQHGAQL